MACTTHPASSMSAGVRYQNFIHVTRNGDMAVSADRESK
jgi:hypothetical protein